MKKHVDGIHRFQTGILGKKRELRAHPSVLTAMARGELKFHALVYEIESNNVMAFDDHTGQYLQSS